MKLNKTDKRLLAYLYHHNREPLSKIAKAVKLSREQVDYRIKKYVSSGLIRSFFGIFDYSKLGYDFFILALIKTGNMRDIFQQLKKSKNCISYGEAFGDHNIYANFIFKNEEEMGDYFSGFLKHKILDYNLIRVYYGELYPLKFLDNKKDSYIMIGKKSEKIEIDKTDKKILKSLALNGREKIINIASGLNITAEAVLYRIRRLQKEKVFLGSRIQFDMEKIGYHYSHALIDINLTEENKMRLFDFAKSSPYVNSLILNLSKPNCIIQLFHKNIDEFKLVVRELRQLFKTAKISIMFVKSEEDLINSLPLFS